MNWFLMKEHGHEFWTQSESREQALKDAMLWGAELIRQANIIETAHLNGDNS